MGQNERTADLLSSNVDARVKASGYRRDECLRNQAKGERTWRSSCMAGVPMIVVQVRIPIKKASQFMVRDSR